MCKVTGSLPVTIPPNESRTIEVSVRLSPQPGLFTRQSGFAVDDEGLRSIRFRIVGRIFAIEGESSSAIEGP